jgi:hypothetical protein
MGIKKVLYFTEFEEALPVELRWDKEEDSCGFLEP